MLESFDAIGRRHRRAGNLQDLKRRWSSFSGPETTSNLETADVGQVDVQNHKIGALGRDLRQSFSACRGLEYRESGTSERRHLDESAGVLVVHDENGGSDGHGWTSAGRECDTTSWSSAGS